MRERKVHWFDAMSGLTCCELEPKVLQITVDRDKVTCARCVKALFPFGKGVEIINTSFTNSTISYAGQMEEWFQKIRTYATNANVPVWINMATGTISYRAADLTGPIPPPPEETEPPF